MSDAAAAPADDTTLTFVTKDDNEYVLAVSLMKRSGLVATLLLDEDEDNEKVHLPQIASTEFQKVVEFLQSNQKEPLKVINRPLKSAELTDSGVPAWADEFIKKTPMGEELLALIDAAAYMQLKMLKQLGCARIAAEIKAVGLEKLREQFGLTEPLTAEQEKKLKDDNPWAWKYDDMDVTADGDDEPGAAPAEEAAGAGAGTSETKAAE